MASERVPPHSLARFAEGLLGRGRYAFTKAEATSALHISDNAFRSASHRLIREKLLMRIVNEFYVVNPAEYRPSGGVPGTHYIDTLMKFREQPYYVGVLSAAALHGAAHQAPQELQIVTSAPMATIIAARTRIRFLTKQDIAETPVQKIKSQAGFIWVSTPEATAFDLIRYPHAAAGLNNILTVLTELAETMDPKKLAAIAQITKPSYVQRLGHLLDRSGSKQLAKPMIASLEKRRWDYILLRAGRKTPRAQRDTRWRVIINEQVEPDL